MRHIAFAVLLSCVLVLLGGPAKAGDYYNDGYHRHRHHGHVWYSSSCCYKKVVRHERTVRYSRIEEERPHYRHGYYDRPYRSGYYDRPYRSSYYDRPYRDGYYDRPYRPVTYYDQSRHDVGDNYLTRGYGYDGYSELGAFASSDNCYRRQVPVPDGRGGWVWGAKLNCY